MGAETNLGFERILLSEKPQAMEEIPFAAGA